MLAVSGCVLEASKEVGSSAQDAGVEWRQPLQRAAGGEQPMGIWRWSPDCSVRSPKSRKLFVSIRPGRCSPGPATIS